MKSVVIALGLAAVSSGPVEPLIGTWGAFGARLTFTESGGVLQQECAFTSLSPVLPDKNGRFEVTGTMDQGSGRQKADQATNTQSVLIKGTLKGETLRLELVGAGADKVLLTLQKDSRAKIVRCM